jgi:hypothetical protein
VSLGASWAAIENYTWKVYATDLAGNVQSSIGSKKLTVK